MTHGFNLVKNLCGTVACPNKVIEYQPMVLSWALDLC